MLRKTCHSMLFRLQVPIYRANKRCPCRSCDRIYFASILNLSTLDPMVPCYYEDKNTFMKKDKSNFTKEALTGRSTIILQFIKLSFFGTLCNVYYMCHWNQSQRDKPVNESAVCIYKTCFSLISIGAGDNKKLACQLNDERFAPRMVI